MLRLLREQREEIVDAIVQKMGEWGFNNSRLKKWLKDVYGMGDTAAKNYIRSACLKNQRAYGRSPKELIAEMALRLDSIIYDGMASANQVIEAIKTKAQLLGVWKISVASVQPQFDSMSGSELLEEVNAD